MTSTNPLPLGISDLTPEFPSIFLTLPIDENETFKNLMFQYQTKAIQETFKNLNQSTLFQSCLPLVVTIMYCDVSAYILVRCFTAIASTSLVKLFL